MTILEIINLYNRLKKIETYFLDYQKRQNLLPVRECFTDIQKFTVWYLQENHLKVSNEDWKMASQRLLEILRDIVQAVEQDDYVLMHDAICYGLQKYLYKFITDRRTVEEH